VGPESTVDTGVTSTDGDVRQDRNQRNIDNTNHQQTNNINNNCEEVDMMVKYIKRKQGELNQNFLSYSLFLDNLYSEVGKMVSSLKTISYK
jgi:hypothetical protein